MLTLRLGELPLRFAETWFSLGRLSRLLRRGALIAACLRRPANSARIPSMASVNSISRLLAKPGLMVWAIVAAACLVVGMSAFAFFLMDWVPVVQASVTTLAVLFAGAWAMWRVFKFRELHGFLVITQEVSHVRIADGATHVQVIATLRNQSRVSMRPDEGFCYIEGILIGAAGASAHTAASTSGGNPWLTWTVGWCRPSRNWSQARRPSINLTFCCPRSINTYVPTYTSKILRNGVMTGGVQGGNQPKSTFWRPHSVMGTEKIRIKAQDGKSRR